MNYGEVLKKMRMYDLITQDEIAKLLGISKKTYSLYETQEKIIPIKHLNKLCNYFNVSIDYVLKLSKTKTYLNSKNTINTKLFSQRTKSLRLENSLTQLEFAKRVNVD